MSNNQKQLEAAVQGHTPLEAEMLEALRELLPLMLLLGATEDDIGPVRRIIAKATNA